MNVFVINMTGFVIDMTGSVHFDSKSLAQIYSWNVFFQFSLVSLPDANKPVTLSDPHDAYTPATLVNVRPQMLVDQQSSLHKPWLQPFTWRLIKLCCLQWTVTISVVLHKTATARADLEVY